MRSNTPAPAQLDRQARFAREASRVVGAVLYRIGRGRLEGVWTVNTIGAGGPLGVEEAEKTDGAPGEIPGRYDVRIWAPGHGAPEPPVFEGTLHVALIPGGAGGRRREPCALVDGGRHGRRSLRGHRPPPPRLGRAVRQLLGGARRGQRYVQADLRSSSGARTSARSPARS